MKVKREDFMRLVAIAIIVLVLSPVFFFIGWLLAWVSHFLITPIGLCIAAVCIFALALAISLVKANGGDDER